MRSEATGHENARAKSSGQQLRHYLAGRDPDLLSAGAINRFDAADVFQNPAHRPAGPRCDALINVGDRQAVYQFSHCDKGAEH
jgi:hypothetical protein